MRSPAITSIDHSAMSGNRLFSAMLGKVHNAEDMPRTFTELPGQAMASWASNFEIKCMHLALIIGHHDH